MKRKFLLIYLGILLNLNLSAAGPDSSRHYSLALYDHDLLYSEQTQKGIDRDFADELIRRSGCIFTVSLLPRARIWQLIESGALDFGTSGITNSSRDSFADFAWYFSDKYYLLIRTDCRAPSIADFERNKNLRLGIVRSFRYGQKANQFVDRLAAENRVDYSTSQDVLYEVLLLNRIQGIIIEPFDLPQITNGKLRTTTTIIEFDDPAIPHGLIISKKSIPESERKKWHDIVDGMRKDGTLLKIFSKYLAADIARELVNL